MCLYDLQKAFDSVEYPVLLEKLYNVGVNGKMWRLLNNWYRGGFCQVKVDGRVSDRFMVESGVKHARVGVVPNTVSTGNGPLFEAIAGIWVGTVSQSVLCVRLSARR